MKKLRIVLIFSILALAFAACSQGAEVPTDELTIQLWTQEGESDNALQYVTSLTDAFTTMYPNITFEVVQKDTETLREDFQTASLAGAAPDLLWTVSDHAGPFTTAGIIQPVDDYFDMDIYVPSVVMNGQTWGVPISSGNHLMLYYNKALIAEPPADTDELIAKAQELTSGDQYGIVYNMTEPFWLAPWLGGFDGSVFAEDGVTPTLNTQAMIDTLQFMYDLKFTYGVIPESVDYDTADTLFKEGKAAMLINGDWSLGGYQELLGEDFGVAPIPMVTSTGKYPAPYTSGKYFMFPKDLSGAKLDAVVKFVEFATNEENQLNQLNTLKRLPGLKAVLDNEAIASDPILAGSAKQMSYGVPMPSVVEMRCIWDAIKPEQNLVLAGNETPVDAAAAMQSAAEACILQLE
ncbi:MAG TPA: sugar ABC transporter substrate-binding protein [Anaerolineaceae bacterium]|nr:sugar ABC transporter substrate-binding protein [Anaerolineaceae bacterium]